MLNQHNNLSRRRLHDQDGNILLPHSVALLRIRDRIAGASLPKTDYRWFRRPVDGQIATLPCDSYLDEVEFITIVERNDT